MKPISAVPLSFATICMLGCATTGHESVSFEKKKGSTIVHHLSRTSNGLVDRIDTLSPSGIVSRAEIHVYDIGRLPHGEGGMDEAHRYYRVVQSEHLDLRVPRPRSTGPKTAFTPPTYSALPNPEIS